MEIIALKLAGSYQIKLNPRRDVRGYFARVWDNEFGRKHGLLAEWVQENQSYSSRRGIIRGLHFQRPPYAETKLVRVVSGAVWDVLVDLRKGSPTYGQWDALELSAAALNLVYVPKGFAHGFCTLTDHVLVLYKVDACYSPEAEGGVRWNDEALKIPWPVNKPLLSERDCCLPRLRDFVSPF